MALQGLNKRLYFLKVPTFVPKVLIRSFPRMLPKHEFINMVRTMNAGTHKYKVIEYAINNKKGFLKGEFLKREGLPDGRCVFVSRSG